MKMNSEGFGLGDIYSIKSIVDKSNKPGRVEVSELDIRWNPKFDPTADINRTFALASDEDKIKLAKELVKCWMFDELDTPWFQRTFDYTIQPLIRNGLFDLFGKDYKSRNPNVMGSLGGGGEFTFSIWQDVPLLWSDGTESRTWNSEREKLEEKLPLLCANGPLEKISSCPGIILPGFAEFSLPNETKIFMPYIKLR
jgi:hypothetical protein